jgi:hypothetical protein
MRSTSTRLLHALILGIALGAGSIPAAAAGPGEELAIDCRIVYETAEGLYVGFDAGVTLHPSEKGSLRKDGIEIAKVIVVNAATANAFLQIESASVEELPRPGEAVVLVVERIGSSRGAPRAPSRTLKDQNADSDPFAPLLSPQNMSEKAFTKASDLFHGNLTLRQILQSTDADGLDYFATHVRSSGVYERIRATPWNLEWSGDASYRGGDGYADGRDHEEVRLEVYRFTFARKFDDDSTVRFGRFLPRELPAVGFIDGAHGELVVNDEVRFGAIAGFKPTRDDLNVAVDEPTLVVYGTISMGERGKTYYSGTTGLLYSLFEGDADRLAMLSDQTAQLGPLSVYASTEVDVDVGTGETYDGARLSRLNLVATYALSRALELRAGTDRFEIEDTEAMRESINPGNLNPVEFLDDGYWRFWAGASHQLPWSLRLSEEISFVDSDESDDAVRWNVSLTRTGLPVMPAGQVTVTIYNFEGVGTDGYGGRVSAYLPMQEGRLSLQPSVALRFLDFETSGANFFDRVSKDFEVTDVSLRAHWTISRAWSVDAGVSYAFTEDFDRVLADVALMFRW